MCIFCKIINKEIPAHILHEDENFIVILDIMQATKGHTLIIPKKHSENIFNLEQTTISNIFPLVQKIAIRLKERLSLEGLNIINNNGKIAGQTVMHYHIHLIPRYVNDNLVITFDKTEQNFAELVKILK
ncbi:MAG: HIT family protein [Erysipelotrichales bacterium]|nr:HIT family protein [Erysipelotrichales bacterium]